MADYDLTRLGNREFEHIVQALAKAEIATGVTPFGEGPDGAREATFEGNMSYPSMGDAWDGYLVIQSKFKQRPAANPGPNGTWFINQIKADLDKFLDLSRGLRRPEYYLATTNIHLTPTQGTGTYDRAIETLTEYASQLNLKGFDVWALDDISRLLDGNDSIRKAYSHLVTPGDTLSALIDASDALRGTALRSNSMRALIARFKVEAEENETFSGVIPKLQHFSNVVDAPEAIQGLEGKLTDAGYENFLHLGITTKEQFAKKLIEFQFSRSAQEILSFLLAEVFTRFHTSVLPAISSNESHAVVFRLVQSEVINPISDLVEENVLDLYADELTGMLYFLTGNCHIKWKL